MQIYQQTAEAAHLYPLKDSVIIASILGFNQTSFESNKAECIDVSMMLNNISFTLIKQSNAVGNVGHSIIAGTSQFIGSWIDSLQDPKQLCKDCLNHACASAQMITTLLYFVTQNFRIPKDDRTLLRFLSENSCNDDPATFRDCWNAAITLAQESTKKFDQDPVINLTQEGLNWILNPFIACKVLSKTFKLLKHAKDITSARLHLFTQIASQESQTAQTCKIASNVGELEESLYHLMQSEKDLVATNSAYQAGRPSWNYVVEQLSKYGNKIPAHEENLIAMVENHLQSKMSQAYTWIPSHVHESFCNITKTLNSQTILIKEMKLDHIANYWYKFRLNNSETFYNFILDGGHFAGSACKLEQLGLIRIIEELDIGYGCKQFTLENIITKKTFIKTEFPNFWDIKTIGSKILESLENIEEFTKIADDYSEFILVGKTRDGVSIKIILNNFKNNGLELITAYPVTISKAKL